MSIDHARLLNGLRAQFATGRTRTLRWRLSQLRGIARMCEEAESEIIAQPLLALGFDHALFTGGTEIGRKVMAAAGSPDHGRSERRDRRGTQVG